MQLLRIVTPDELYHLNWKGVFLENISFQSKCGFCSPYQLGPDLEANTSLLIDNITIVRSQVWGSLSNLLDPVAFFVDSSKV